jgi:hypothetical protein
MSESLVQTQKRLIMPSVLLDTNIAKINDWHNAFPVYNLTPQIVDEWKLYLGETKEKYKRRPALQNQLAKL